MIEIIDGVWAAGETKTFHINGEYVEVLDALYTCDIFLMDKVGAQLSTMKGCEVSFFSRPKEGFQTIQVKSSQAQYMRFFVGSGDAGTRRISSTVQVVDGGRARTIADSAYMGVFGVVPDVTTYAQVQLYNSSADKRVIVKAYGATVAGGPVVVNVGYLNATLTAANGGLINKRAGGAASATTRFRSQFGAALTAAVTIDQFAFQGAGGSSRVLQEPIVLSSNQGIVIEATSKNIGVTAFFEVVEEAIV